MQVQSRKLRIGLALGAGASHGWAHIGVIRRLEEAGVVPDIVCGCSAGALVGAYYAADKLDLLQDWVHSLTVRRTFAYMRVRQGRSLFGEKLLRQMIEHFRRVVIEDLAIPFAAVATDVETGREITAQTGPLTRAVAASGAFPLLFPPVKIDSRWAVDGCLVNPVPVSTCRALGADLVIAVPVVGSGEKSRLMSEARAEAEQWSGLLGVGGKGESAGGAGALAAEPGRSRSGSRWARAIAAVERCLSRLCRSGGNTRRAPGVASILLRLAVSRKHCSSVAGVHPDILIEPRLGRLSLGAGAALRAIAAGRAAAAEVQTSLLSVVQAAQDRIVEAGAGKFGVRRPNSGQASLPAAWLHQHPELSARAAAVHGAAALMPVPVEPVPFAF